MCAGVMSAYASFAPATTNIWADNNYICYINCITSFFAGFVVFSILGNMAHRQRTIAGENPALRVALCESNEQSLGDLNLDGCPECSLCGLAGWQNLQYSACCGDFSTDNVAQDSFVLVFSVRSCSHCDSARALVAILVSWGACMAWGHAASLQGCSAVKPCRWHGGVG